MSATRTRRLLVNVLGGIAGRAFGLAAPFLLMPAMLAYLGAVQFGIWMTAISLTSMALFSDLGIGNGLLTRLSEAHGRQDDEAARSDIATAYLLLSAVALALAALLAMLLGAALLIGDRLHVPLPDLQTTAIVAACFAGFLATIPANVIQRVMYARQDIMLNNLWQIAGTGLAVSACFAAIAAGWPAWSVVLIYGMAPVAMMAVSAWVYFRQHRQIGPRWSAARWQSGRQLLAIGGRFLVLGIISSVALNADNAIIAAAADARTVTDYSVPAKLGSLLGLLVTTIYLPLWSANGDALARGEHEWVRRNTYRMAVAGGSTIALAAIVLTLAGNQVIALWMGQSFPHQQIVLLLMGLLSLVMAATSPFQMVLNSQGVIAWQVAPALAFLLLSLPIKYTLAKADLYWCIPGASAVLYAMTCLRYSISRCKVYFAENGR